MSWIEKFFPNVVPIWTGDNGVVQAIQQTLYMTLVTAVCAGILGLIIGILLVLTDQHGLLQNDPVYFILDKLVNIFRAVPFIILLAVMTPFTRAIVGTGIGPTAALVPLVAGVTPFYARQVQNALLTVDPGVIEAAESMGISPLGITFRVYLREGLSELIRVSVLTIISAIGLTAMAGAVGGGGLGNLAIAVGYQRYQNDVVWVALIFILVLVFLVQFIGDLLARKTHH
ncbi:methionine ABC transporter permease [Lacticaseibacillus nasuensis]|uniref:Amino acid ABC transporter permease protein n=1 Tax=Lacticaseibacillus nasuensis JCM 17158 TaxID=1291734 RepID=A0A0R1JSV8_9LACO|nr:methionine ABC transporter permease [Lacticaseibacillus nasuensis]KRK74139.1 amino acid ABC transporter permease protein [Lacticaseibacillus nasuensis JCM 17158]MCX2455333.1 ABC transporter permease [Lacticaseibacillus nasuensis]